MGNLWYAAYENIYSKNSRSLCSQVLGFNGTVIKLRLIWSPSFIGNITDLRHWSLFQKPF